MEDIIADARALGKKIAANPRTVSFMNAARAVESDSEAQKVLRAYQEQAVKIQELQNSGKPIEPEDKRKLQDCEGAIAANEKIKEMMKAQADYLEMMHRINGAIDEAIQSSP